MEFSGALKGRSRGWTIEEEGEPVFREWREVQVRGWCAALAARIFDGLAVACATRASFVEFHAIWVNGRADQTAPIFCRPILRTAAPPRNVNDTANLVSMPATTQCRGLVDVLLSPSLFYSLFLSLDAHGIDVLTLSLLLFLSSLCGDARIVLPSFTHTDTHILS